MATAPDHCVPKIEEAYATRFSVGRVRRDFPALDQQVHGKPLIYFDNAATSQKPKAVIDALRRYYEEDNSNVHRGVHTLSQRATDGYEGAREIVRRFLNAASSKEIVWVRGATEGINLVAQSYGRTILQAGDEIVLSELEHHSNIIPWQLVAEQTGATIKVIPVTDAGELDMAAYESLLSDRTKIVSVNHISNALGTLNPVKEIIDKAHAAGAAVLIDGCQAAPHIPVDVQALDADFYVFSGHKVFGPTGIGVLYAKEELLDKMPPYQGGGDMIDRVSFDGSTWADLPHKFEAGTPNIAGAIGLGVALEYVEKLDLNIVADYETDLLRYATLRMEEIDGLRLIGTAPRKASVLSFIVDDVHPHDIGTILDMKGVAIRVGHHCAQPLMKRYGIPATARASLAFYNTKHEVDEFIAALQKALKMFR